MGEWVQRLIIPLGFVLLAGCGKELEIADSVTMRVQFAQQLVQVTFSINPLYQIRAAFNRPFRIEESQLARFFLNYDDAAQLNEVSVLFSVAQAQSGTDWPVHRLTRLTSDARFPSSVTSRFLESWDLDENQIRMGLLYHIDGDLIVGGKLLSHHFDLIPEGLVAHQHFYSEDGTLEATMSLVGPSFHDLGGLYFIGNFGDNPFSLSQNRTIRLWSAGPATIVDEQKIQWWHYFVDWRESVQNVLRTLEHSLGFKP